MMNSAALVAQLQRVTRHDENVHFHADLATPTWPAAAPQAMSAWAPYWVRFSA